jgi:hypothetical protein
MGFSRDERLDKLNDTAISQMKIIVQSNAFDVLKNDNEGQDNLQLPAIG